jgi:hypothetical protein
MPVAGVVVNVTLERSLRSARIAVERELAEHGHRNERSGSGQQPPARKLRHG